MGTTEKNLLLLLSRLDQRNVTKYYLLSLGCTNIVFIVRQYVHMGTLHEEN